MAKSAKNLAHEEIEKLSSQEEDFSEDINDEEENIFDENNHIEDEENLNTHQKIKKSLCGNVIFLEKGHSKTTLQTTNDMSVDTLGLIHSGFIFGAAEYAAVSAINEENLVIISSKTKFLAPAKNGDLIEFDAKAKFEDSRKREVKVIGEINEIKIFEGTYQAVVLENHILKTKLKNINKNYHAR
ncbi:MAG: PaaI family thioesterase [Sulfurospirillum sp.]